MTKSQLLWCAALLCVLVLGNQLSGGFVFLNKSVGGVRLWAWLAACAFLVTAAVVYVVLDAQHSFRTFNVAPSADKSEEAKAVQPHLRAMNEK